mgnify:CR=1 FL=1
MEKHMISQLLGIKVHAQLIEIHMNQIVLVFQYHLIHDFDHLKAFSLMIDHHLNH